jgi:glycosyltransferase involved in cell wall biosynthesis
LGTEVLIGRGQIGLDNQLNIAHLIATNFFGGPEKQIIEHLMQVKQSSFSILLISFIERSKPNELLDDARKKKIPTRNLYTWNPFNPKVILELISILKRDKIDILCTHGYKSDVIGRIASWILRIPQIVFSRGWTAENKKIKLFEQLDKWFIRFADHIVAVSEGQKEKVLKLKLIPDKVSVVYNGINLDNIKIESKKSMRAELGINENSCLVVSAGRLSPEKNFGGLIEAAKIVTKKNKNIIFVVFGEGFLRKELEQKVLDSGLKNKFLLPGFRKDFFSLLSDIDIFVLVSYTEGLPNVLLEAYSFKKPVVASKVGGIPEVVIDGETGFLVSVEDTDGLAEYILKLTQDPDLRKKMGNKGCKNIKENFNFDIQTKKLKELYLKVYEKYRSSIYYNRCSC